MPGALKKNAAAIGSAFIAALTLGAGQFCTNPGLVLAIDGPDVDAFTAAAGAALGAASGAPMLTAGIKTAYEEGIARLAIHPAVEKVASGVALAIMPSRPCSPPKRTHSRSIPNWAKKYSAPRRWWSAARTWAN